MKGSKTLAVLSLVACIAGCSSETETVRGVVYDATMNGVTIIADGGDTISVSTMDTDPQKVHGVLLYDSVRISYSVEHCDEVCVRRAQTLDVLSSPYDLVVGRWVEPNPIAPDEVQGVEVLQDGTASSINMHTLLFKSWNLTAPDSIVFTVESIGNGMTIRTEQTYAVRQIDGESVLVPDGEEMGNLYKEK